MTLVFPGNEFLDPDLPAFTLVVLPHDHGGSADLDHVVLDPRLAQIAGHRVDTVALGDGGQVDAHARSGFGQRTRSPIRHQQAGLPHLIQGRCNVGLIWHRVFGFSRTKTPKPDQRSQDDIERAVGFGVNVIRGLDHQSKFIGYRHWVGAGRG